jgi:hypothetical protein
LGFAKINKACFGASEAVSPEQLEEVKTKANEIAAELLEKLGDVRKPLEDRTDALLAFAKINRACWGAVSAENLGAIRDQSPDLIGALARKLEGESLQGPERKKIEDLLVNIYKAGSDSGMHMVCSEIQKAVENLVSSRSVAAQASAEMIKNAAFPDLELPLICDDDLGDVPSSRDDDPWGDMSPAADSMTDFGSDGG